MKYPHVAFAAVASSAPVRAEEDFPGYCEVVYNSLKNPIVGGSDACVNAVSEAFQTIDKYYDQNETGWSVLEKHFNSCYPLTSNDVSQLVETLADPFQGAAQYNGQIPGQAVVDVCKIMTEGCLGGPFEKLASFLPQGQCNDFREKTMLKQIKNTKYVSVGGVGVRQWTWQTCVQFGYYQTCEPAKGNCPFSKLMNLQSYLDICEKVFDLTNEDVLARIKFSDEYYGSDHIAGSRIVFVNGDIDPWHALSVIKDLPNDETAVYIDGASHCQDMDSNKPGDSTYLRKGRQQIEQKVAQWLQLAQMSPVTPISLE